MAILDNFPTREVSGDEYFLDVYLWGTYRINLRALYVFNALLESGQNPTDLMAQFIRAAAQLEEAKSLVSEYNEIRGEGMPTTKELFSDIHLHDIENEDLQEFVVRPWELGSAIEAARFATDQMVSGILE